MAHDCLDESWRQISELLQRQRLVARIVKRQSGHKQDIVEELVHRQHSAELEKKLRAMHPADVAALLELLPVPDRREVWERVIVSRGGEVLLELGGPVRRGLIRESDPAALRRAIGQLDADDLAEIAEDLPRSLLDERRTALSTGERQWLDSSLTYAADSVGALMSRDVLTVRADECLEEILERLRASKKLPDLTDQLYVVDRRGKLAGTLPLQALLLLERDALAGEHMLQTMASFSPEQPALAAAKVFERYDLVSVPVINGRRKVVGRLTVDTVMDFVGDRLKGDALNSVGLVGEEDLFASMWHSARNRWLWISLSLATAMLASRVIGLFEQTIAQVVALAALMPIVAAIGGNTGNQTATLVVRGLALDHIHPRNLGHLVRKELGLGLLNGVLWGTVVGVFALFFYGDPGISLVISAAMVITLLVAALLALLVPLTLHYFKRDPALGSSVLVTAFTDSIGFFTFLGLATLFLV